MNKCPQCRFEACRLNILESGPADTPSLLLFVNKMKIKKTYHAGYCHILQQTNMFCEIAVLSFDASKAMSIVYLEPRWVLWIEVIYQYQLKLLYQNLHHAWRVKRNQNCEIVYNFAFIICVELENFLGTAKTIEWGIY